MFPYTRQSVSLLVIICLIAIKVCGQDNPCREDWSEWRNVYTFAPNVDFQMSFKYQIRNRKGGDCGTSVFRFKNPYMKPGSYLDISFDYRQKDGTVATNKLGYIELDKTGVRESNSANWYTGYEVISITAKYIDPQKDKAQSLTGKINNEISNFDERYNEITGKLAKMKDAGKRSSLQQKMNSIHKMLLQYKQVAERQLEDGDGDGMQRSLNKIKEQQDELTKIEGDISTPLNTAETNSKTTTTNTVDNFNNKNPNSLYNGTITNTPPARTTAPNTYAQQFQQQQNQQKQVYQNNAAAVNAAGNAVQNLMQQKFDAEQKKRDEEHNKTMANIQQSLDEGNKRLEDLNEANRQTNLDMRILEFNEHSKVLPSAIYTTPLPDSTKQAFYITYEREYSGNAILLKSYTLYKYADGTWMQESDIKKKINFTTYSSNINMFSIILGPYRSKANVLSVMAKIKANAGAISNNIQTDESFTQINSPAKNTNTNFWNN